ncbi:MAG: hypothetical protein AAGH89_02230 [Verrucomicrobiota bacterium]
MKSFYLSILLLAACALPNAQAIDLDGGMSDVWEALVNGGQPLQPNDDVDGDQMTNLTEYYFQLDPLVADVNPTMIELVDPTTIRLKFLAPTAMRFQFEESFDLTSWATPFPVFTGTGALEAIQQNPQSNQKAFLRVRAFGPEDDLDGDFLDGWEESHLGTNPSLFDSDATDGMGDGYEWVYGLDPLADNSATNKDGDGALDIEDSNPDDNSVGQLQITITSPGNGSNLP